MYAACKKMTYSYIGKYKFHIPILKLYNHSKQKKLLEFCHDLKVIWYYITFTYQHVHPVSSMWLNLSVCLFVRLHIYIYEFFICFISPSSLYFMTNENLFYNFSTFENNHPCFCCSWSLYIIFVIYSHFWVPYIATFI